VRGDCSLNRFRVLTRHAIEPALRPPATTSSNLSQRPLIESLWTSNPSNYSSPAAVERRRPSRVSVRRPTATLSGCWRPGIPRPVRSRSTSAAIRNGEVSRSTVASGTENDTGIVEFRATYLVPGGGVGAQQERSRFVREDGRWFYATRSV